MPDGVWQCGAQRPTAKHRALPFTSYWWGSTYHICERRTGTKQHQRDCNIIHIINDYQTEKEYRMSMQKALMMAYGSSRRCLRLLLKHSCSEGASACLQSTSLFFFLFFFISQCRFFLALNAVGFHWCEQSFDILALLLLVVPLACEYLHFSTQAMSLRRTKYRTHALLVEDETRAHATHIAMDRKSAAWCYGHANTTDRTTLPL